MPVQTQGSGAGARTSATCEVLDLVLGPLDLNLLGLRVQLNKVHLRITAISGPGNLLGNLLCAVVNLLNQSPLPLNQVSGLLNIVVLQLVNNPALGGLGSRRIAADTDRLEPRPFGARGTLLRAPYRPKPKQHCTRT